ncbi:MAG: hypothetical protein B6U87_00315 [Candidatus Aenigmarchaeota archaeon ex4484_52]|nr:MAG: hypothetical protein B6U87_00315 [Candidatus Aenigmarchaeota archaeon ex4484_52]
MPFLYTSRILYQGVVLLKDPDAHRKIPYQLEKNSCYFYDAIENKDMGICKKIEDKNSCYISVALLKKDISLCEKINSQ